MTRTSCFALLFLLGFAALSVAAPQTDELRISNARIERLGPTGDLEAQLDAIGGRNREAVWTGYLVPMVEGRRHICCRGGCQLEEDRHYYTSDEDDFRPSGDELMVLLRLEGGAIDRIRTYSSDCELDGGGRRVFWISGVEPAQSMALHDRLAREPDEDLASQAVQALAHHRGEEPDRRLEALASSGELPDETREKAVFWMGAARGLRSFEGLSRLAEDAAVDSELREKIVFALHLSPVPESTEKLIEMARTDRDSEIREKAIFWLGQEAGQRAAAAIREAVEEDPDLDVKKKAIFALSQLPADEGVPLLIEMAAEHPQPEIRKRAMFWLGQSGDDRALKFFEEILLRR